MSQLVGVAVDPNKKNRLKGPGADDLWDGF